MPQPAKVTSIDAIEAFRANLILYLNKARPALEEINADVSRARDWLQNDQRKFWEKQLKERRKKLDRAQAELFSAKMSKLTEASSFQQLAVRKAQQAVRDAEEKLVVLQRWDRELENRSEPLVKQVDQMHHFLSSELTRAVVHLSETIRALEAYTDVKPSGAESSPRPAADPPPPDAGEGGPPA